MKTAFLKAGSSLIELIRCSNGAVMIETAIVVPVLAMLSMGGLEVSRMVARQAELQAGAQQGEEIALSTSTSDAVTDINEVRSILATSLSLDESEVTVEKLYRCDFNASLVSDKDTCGESSVVSIYMRITLSDSYTPLWTSFGIGKSFDYNIVRLVQVS